MKDIEKMAVHNFWDAASCGEELYMTGSEKKEQFRNQQKIRYELEPYILNFADFSKYRDKKVLEIGVGLGADHQNFAENNAILYGVDLTQRAIEFTKERLGLFNLNSELKTDDAENLSFTDSFFDLVYSWGVIHHSPNTPLCAKQIHRVLKNGGTAKVMIYHKYSFVGYMLWVRYALLKLKPFTSLSEIYSKYLESPGTKAYTVEEARLLFKDFRNVKISTILTHGDLLSSNAGQRHQGMALSVARKIWPRWLIKTFFPSHGLFMLITAEK
jgi:ubiquinone/menaquinone biosynthesis C-methylase UbiE